MINGELYQLKILTNSHGHWIASGIKEYFRDVGISSTIVESIDKEDASKNVLYFVLFSFLYDFPVGLRYIVYQLEQRQQSSWFTDKYNKILQESLYIFDYSVQNYQHTDAELQRKMAYLPVPLSLADEDYSDDIEYDVLFYGGMCARRMRILDDLQNKHGVRIKIVGDVFRKDLDALIKKARVVLNIHYYDNALLETTRINEALARDKIVLSEEPMADDKYSRHLYKDVVIFSKNLDDYNDKDIQELAQLLKFYSLPGNFRRYIRHRKKKLVSLKRYFVGRFIRGLLSLQAFPPTRFYKRLSPETIYYLSLDEFWQSRRENFLIQPHVPPNVERLAGIKASPGWMGCGMSYKFAINSAKLSGLQQVTICEDDAEFPPSFAGDYKIIREYLSTLDTWDIFVGLIADFDNSTRILNVETFKGIEFVTIDKFTSTVFNIYRNSSFDHILSWDEHNMDVDTNTIDRYLQTKNLTIITTSPYIFKHMELGSTLWGNGTQYPSLFASSMSRLSAKVQEFKLDQIWRTKAAAGKKQNKQGRSISSRATKNRREFSRYKRTTVPKKMSSRS